jgi:hypothetical protein
MNGELKFSVAAGSARKLRIFPEDLSRVARPLARLGALFKRLFAVPLAGCDGFAPFSFPYAGKEEMPEQFATCPCQYCNKNIEFEASRLNQDYEQIVNCPHCGLETRIYIPSGQAKNKQTVMDAIKKQKIVIAGVFAFALIIVGWLFIGTEAKSEIFKGVFATIIMVIAMAIMWRMFIEGLWLKFFSVIISLLGGFLAISGAFDWLQIDSDANSTVFQQWEAILMTIGGIIILTLGLILAAVISLVRKSNQTLDNPKDLG